MPPQVFVRGSCNDLAASSNRNQTTIHLTKVILYLGLGLALSYGCSHAFVSSQVALKHTAH